MELQIKMQIKIENKYRKERKLYGKKNLKVVWKLEIEFLQIESNQMKASNHHELT